MTYDVDWVDAFTDQPFGGNGCAVVYDADELGIKDRLALVRETKLSECAFLVRSDKADFGARYYLADREILMAGHPTVATIRSLIHRGHVAVPSTLTLEVGAGVLPITVTGTLEAPLITMTQMRPSFGADCTPKRSQLSMA
ncbi:PhzF family phenazine biosynthesis protein [Halovulum sp. GXIMD14793]